MLISAISLNIGSLIGVLSLAQKPVASADAAQESLAAPVKSASGAIDCLKFFSELQGMIDVVVADGSNCGDGGPGPLTKTKTCCLLQDTSVPLA